MKVLKSLLTKWFCEPSVALCSLPWAEGLVENVFPSSFPSPPLPSSQASNIVHTYFFFRFINLFMAALSLHCCAWTFLSIESRGYSSCGARASHCSGFSCWGAWALGAQASVAAACGLSCYLACGIFPNQGSNMCPLHWQADSQSLECQGNPHTCFFF